MAAKLLKGIIMSLQETPSSERIHIGFFGLMNVGKSSLINALTGQSLSLVSDVPGTTTDPVKKAMELLPLGPVVIIDTAGIDDTGKLGEMRAERAKKVLDQTDIAVLVTEAGRDLLPSEQELIGLFKEKNIDFLIAYNKDDPEGRKNCASVSVSGSDCGDNCIYVSALQGKNIHELKEKLGSFAQKWEEKRRVLAADLLAPGEIAVLVIPIDESAPKGRLILPQQQVMRELLDMHRTCMVCQPEEIPQVLDSLAVKPKLVITDSQAFEQVAGLVPADIPLTSFSILFARYKGSLETLVAGAAKLSKLKDGDKVLISEGCTHHRQCNDIGTVKMPGWIERFSNAKALFSFSSGHGFPDDLDEYSLIVHCGGCMLGEKEMQSRMLAARKAGVPMVNYGIAIAFMHGILQRSLELFPDAAKLLP